MSKTHIEDIKKIMSIEEEMIRLLPQLDDKLGLLNPWVRQLPGVFRGLALRPDQTVLDIPCGKGGVSVPLAKRYGVKVIGYDIVEDYVAYAGSLATKSGVEDRCTFEVEDIREVTKREDVCDLLLWIAPPHLWRDAQETIKALRNCVRSGGIVLIADAYAYEPTERYEDYQTLNATNEGYAAFGDELIRCIDYKSTLWQEDYARTRKSAENALEKLNDARDRAIVTRYLRSLDEDEASDTKHLGCAIWILRIDK
jgi:cyclopropane fatty-acyl-phospholipid synthase-like methyltransferase